MNPYARVRYVEVYTDRHGKVRAYYRRGKDRRIALPTEGTREECLAAYYAVAADYPNGAKRVPKRRATAKASDFEVCVGRMLAACKSRSGAKGMDIDLTAAWLRDELARLNYRCALTGLPFSSARSGNGRNPFAPSVDRVDSKRGYTADNTRIVLASVNVALSDWGDAHFDQMCRAYVAKQDGKRA